MKDLQENDILGWKERKNGTGTGVPNLNDILGQKGRKDGTGTGVPNLL